MIFILIYTSLNKHTDRLFTADYIIVHLGSNTKIKTYPFVSVSVKSTRKYHLSVSILKADLIG